MRVPVPALRAGMVRLGLLALLAVSAWLSASLVNRVLGHSLTALPELSPLGPMSHPAREAPVENGVIVQRNYFQSALAPVDDPPPLPPDEPILTNDAPLCPLDLRLVGTVVTKRPDWSLAVIKGREVGVFRAADEVEPGLELAAVGTDRVWLWREGQLELLLLAPGAAPARPAPAQERTQGVNLALRQEGPGRFAVDRDQVRALLANPGRLMKDARIVPAGNGGFRILAIKPESLYARLGMQNGDVLRKLNGYGLDDPTRLLEIFQRLKSARQVELEFARRGKRERLSVSIR